MYTVIIADDEVIECRALEQILQDNYANIRLLPSVYDGEGLLLAVQQEHPDIIITDINMPGLNGLEALEILREKSVNSKVIINTAYSEFDYAQKAISLGASGFLVKPLEKEAFLKIFSKILEKTAYEKNLERRVLEDSGAFRKMLEVAGKAVISSVILGKPDVEELQIWLEHMGHTYWGGVFVAVKADRGTDLRLVEQRAGREWKKVCRFLSEQYEGKLLLFLFPDEGIGKENYEVWLTPILTGLAELLDRENGAVLRFGVSRWKYDYEKMVEAYQESVAALEQQTGFITYFEDTDLFSEKGWKASRMPEDLPELIKGGKKKVCRDFWQKWYTLWQETGMGLCQGQVVLMRLLKQCSQEVCGCSIFSWQQIRTALGMISGAEEFVEEMMRCLERLEKIKDTESIRVGYVRDTLIFIEKNYARDITLEEAAAEHEISSFYLSRLLTQQLQTSFVELLTSARVNSALELLSGNSTKMKNLSGRVGFQSPAYFYKVFKKTTGMTVGEMREFLKG